MKKLSLIVLLFFVYVIGNSQNTSTQNLGAPRTLVVNKGGLKSDSALILPSFPDTTSANLSQYVNYYAGNIIRVGDTVYVRNNTATKWVKISGSNVTTPNLQQVTNVDSTTNRVVSVRELNLLDVDGSGGYDLNLKGYNMGLAFTDKNAEQILKINGTGVGTPKLYFGESGASATLIPAGINTQLNLPSINGTLALVSDITYPDTTVIATHTYVDSSTKTKIDSLKRSTDSVFALKNGTWRFQYMDSVGVSDTASVVKALVHNAEATTLTKGTIVYLYGATGNIASVKRAYNTSDTFSSKTFAVVKEDIPHGGNGIVITQGVVDKLQLGAYSEGDIVYLDSVPGQFTKVKPLAPYHLVFIGIVERANNGNGELFVKVQNGYELGELHNVSVNSQADNDVLYYESSTKLWKAKSPYQLVDTSSLSSRINTKLNTSDSSTYFTKYRSDTMRTNLYTAINGKQASGSYLTEDPVILAQQAMGSTIKGVCLAARSFRDLVGGLQPVSGTLYLTAYYLTQSATITGVKFYQSVGGVFTANNFNGFALYTYSGGVLTQVAITANDGNNWKFTSGTTPAIPFTSTYSASAGLYFIGGIYSTSAVTTAPIMGHGGTKVTIGAANADFTNTARFTATLASQTSMPSSITMSTTTALTTNIAFYLY